VLADLVRRGETRSTGQISMADYERLWERFGFQGVQYIVPSGGISELTALQAQRNPIVWACISVRVMVFSEVRFAYQNWSAGRPGQLFGKPTLQALEVPWPQATTGDLLARMEVDVSLYGNSYWVRPTGLGQMVRLHPSRVTIATTDVLDPESGQPFGKILIGYFVKDVKGQIVATFTPDEVCHYRPIPDPAHEFRGASWLNALLPDVQADSDLTEYKHAFLNNAATPSLVATFKDKISSEAFTKFKDTMDSAHTGPSNGFKTLYLGSGADVKVVGSNFDDLAMGTVQSAGETRIAAAAGVPASIVGLSEGLKGSALNAGNYSATRRRFADGTIRPLWRSAAGSLATLVPPPTGNRLWYDERDVPFLQEDVIDTAAIHQQDAATILTYIQAGFTPESSVTAVTTGDFTQLEHTGLVSVQLQKPGPAVPLGGTPQLDPTLPDDPEPPPGA
jgi:phage portal protein BeeE